MNAKVVVNLCIEKFETEFDEAERAKFIQGIDDYFGDKIDDIRDEKYAI